jgi:diguanylate cyclase (GGDEF)-like protein
MKLKNKTLFTICVAWLLFLTLAYIGSNRFLIHSFLHLEKERANTDLDRIDHALDQANYSLDTFISDWAHWNELYLFMQGRNPSFLANNLTLTTFINARINLITIWDKNGQLVKGVAIDTENRKIDSFPPPGLNKYFYLGNIHISQQKPRQMTRGFILIKNAIMLIAMAPITDGKNIYTSEGMLIGGRYLNKEMLNMLNSTIKLPIKLFLPDEITKSSELKRIYLLTSNATNHHYNAPINDTDLQGYTVIKDINGDPIGMLQMTKPRYIYLTGEKAVNYFLLTYITAGIIFSLLILWLLRALIIKRVERLDAEVANISQHNAIYERVDASGNDEIASLSSSINHMLDMIQAGQEQLERRVQERTEELQKANIQLQEEISIRKSTEHELVIHKEHLVRLAHYDYLTSLPNRVFFNEILNKAISNANRNNRQLAVLIVDLDRFKQVNDAIGHPNGDRVLKEMGSRFATISRSGDIVARLGGDEYIILLNDLTDSTFAATVAERILNSCEEPITVESHEFFISASIGICVYPNDAESLEDLQKYADMAMYKAKHAGGGTYQYYNREMNVAAHEYIKLEAELRNAIKNQEFVLYYQPLLNLKDGKIKHVEALIRWNHPKLGLINPMTFIPLAEETGLIMPIGEWTIKEACRANKAWQQMGYDPIAVAVNISPKQFRHQDVAQVIADALRETNLSPKYLEIEITETAVMDNADIAINRLRSIHDMGVRIAVDDFGTGYSSISYLKKFPVSVLKIDKQFIKGLPHNQNDTAITSAVIALGHNLGLEIVAEGVETVEQMQYLSEHHCDFVQGYFFSRPLPERKIVLQFTKGGLAKDTIFQ